MKKIIETERLVLRKFGISTQRAEGKLNYYMRLKRPEHFFAIQNSKKNRENLS